MITCEHDVKRFDLERAKAGDVVEYKKNSGDWVECEKFYHEGGSSYVVTVQGKRIWTISDSRLRMKYPPETGLKND